MNQLSEACSRLGDAQYADRYAKERKTVLEQLVEAEKRKHAPDLRQLSNYLTQLSDACKRFGDAQSADRYAMEENTIFEQWLESNKSDKN